MLPGVGHLICMIFFQGMFPWLRLYHTDPVIVLPSILYEQHFQLFCGIIQYELYVYACHRQQYRLRFSVHILLLGYLRGGT